MTASPPLLLLTGLAGSGVSTALKYLEDMGFEAMDNLPLTLLGTVVAESRGPLAVSIDSRNRSFTVQGVLEARAALRQSGRSPKIVYLTSDTAVLERRFTQTRRRHPLARDRQVGDGIAAERAVMAPLEAEADERIDTSDLSIHDLRRILIDRFDPREASQPVITIQSFSYKRGLPREADYVFDVRFLKNPYWDERLRALSGLDSTVGDYILADPNYTPFEARLMDLITSLLPLAGAEGKSYLTIAIGCTGGRHRSVFMAIRIMAQLEKSGHLAQVIHRDL